MTSTIQRDSTCCGLSYGLACSLHNVKKTATKSFPIFRLDNAASFVGLALQTCHVITANKCVQLLTKQLQNCFRLMRQNRRCLSNMYV